MNRAAEIPPVHMVLSAYPPAPARVGLVYQPAPLRALQAILSLAFFWGIAPFTFIIPPHYPFPVLCLATGGYLAHLFWTGRYRVRWFVGQCPRCGGHLRMSLGERISLPHTVPCLACHFEPALEVREESARAAAEPLRHVRPECTGTWAEEWMWDERFLACGGCGARRPATPELRRLARAENERGALLRQLTEEGRFLG
jgi:hypothetical protein